MLCWCTFGLVNLWKNGRLWSLISLKLLGITCCRQIFFYKSPTNTFCCLQMTKAVKDQKEKKSALYIYFFFSKISTLCFASTECFSFRQKNAVPYTQKWQNSEMTNSLIFTFITDVLDFIYQVCENMLIMQIMQINFFLFA